MLPTDPITTMSHETLIFASIGVFLTVLGMVASAAYAGAKLALRSFDREIAAVKELYSTEIKTLKESQDERKLTISTLQTEVQNRVLITRCDMDRVICGDARAERINLLSKKIETLTESLKQQDEKRQQALQENNEMFTDIRLQVGHLTDVAKGLTSHFDLLKNFMIKRSKEFRNPTSEDLMS